MPGFLRGAVLGIGLAAVACTRFADNEFYFYSAYTVLQFIVMATAWNILGGFTGYVNFGSAAFFAPEIAIVPLRGLPPRMRIRSIRSPFRERFFVEPC